MFLLGRIQENMLYNDILTKLTYLTKRNNLSQKELGESIDVERRAMNGRADRNSKFKPEEIKKIESYFGVDLSSVNILSNSLERQNDTIVAERYEGLGERLSQIQDKQEYLDKDMAKLLKIREEDYINLKKGNTEPDIQLLLKMKQYFKVSIDWLLFGEG